MQKLSPEELKNIQSRFRRHPSADLVIPNRPRQIVLAKMTSEPLIEGKIKNGAEIIEGVNAYWETEDLGTHFTIEENKWVFRFDKACRGYFSFSWAFNNDEIEQISNRHLLSVGCSQITTASNRTFATQTHGRATHVQGKSERVFNRSGEFYNNRHIVGFSFQGESIRLKQAFRLWLDFIIIDPRTKSIAIHDPLIAVQERLIL